MVDQMSDHTPTSSHNLGLIKIIQMQVLVLLVSYFYVDDPTKINFREHGSSNACNNGFKEY